MDKWYNMEICCYCGEEFEASPIIQTQCFMCMKFLPTCDKCMDVLDCCECMEE